MNERQGFTGAEVTAVNIERTNRALIPALMQNIPVQIFNAVIDILNRVEHDATHNAGKCQREAERDNEQVHH